jgi:hypothetical protein
LGDVFDGQVQLDPAARAGLLHDPDPDQRSMLAGLDDLTDVEAAVLAADPDEKVVVALARREDLDGQLAATLLGHQSHRVRAYACLRAPVADAEKLVGDHEAVRAMLARIAQTPAVQIALSCDGNSTIRMNLASQARNLCEEAAVNLSGDELSVTRKVVALNATWPRRYDAQRIADLIEWREEGWRSELEIRLDGDRFAAVQPLVDDFPGTFGELVQLADALV